MKARITEIDLLRTIAILMMVTYHIGFDLEVLYDINVHLFSTPGNIVRIVTAVIFLLVSGMASNLSTRPLRRALIVLGCALLITTTTYIYDPKTFIYFGILHCIGLGLLALIPLRKLKELLIPIGIVLILLPEPAAPLPTLDYYPLLPWAGYMLIGAGVGHFLYIRKNVRLLKTNLPVLTAPGRYALPIYLIHQPIILGVLSLMF